MSCVKQRSPFGTVGVYTVCVCVCVCAATLFLLASAWSLGLFLYLFLRTVESRQERASGGWHAENSPVQTQASQASAMFQHMDHLLNQVSFNTGEVLLLNNYRNLYFL